MVWWYGVKFKYDKNASIGMAYYSPLTDTITLNFSKILQCESISDDDKIQFMTWQIEHEVIHAVLDKLEDSITSMEFDNVAWSIRDKKDFLEINEIAEKMYFFYRNRCKYLEKR